MYTRSYNDAIGDIIIPDKYGGTSFVQSGSAEERIEAREPTHNPWAHVLLGNEGELGEIAELLYVLGANSCLFHFFAVCGNAVVHSLYCLLQSFKL